MSEIRSFQKDLAELVSTRGSQMALSALQGLKLQHWSYAEFGALIARGRTLFAERGLATESRIMAMLPNSPETLVLFCAALTGGQRYMTLHCNATEAEATAWVELTKPQLALVSSVVPKKTMDVLARHGIQIVPVPVDGKFDWLPATGSAASTVSGKVLLNTSGTTSEPKAMVVDGDTLWSSGVAFAEFHQLRDKNLRFWNFLPVSYLGGLFNLCLIPLAAGGSIFVDEAFSGKTFLNFWQTVTQNQITALWLVPTILNGLLTLNRLTPEEAREAARNIRCVLLGTAKSDLSKKQEFERRFGIAPLENYALSETTFLTSETVADLGERSDGSVGKVLPYARIHLKPIVDGDDMDAQELVVETPYLFDGYLMRDGSIKRPTVPEGFPTGDLGYLDAHGNFIISGRTKDIIKRGGYLVALWEIESVVAELPCVKECAAIPKSHDFYGESYSLLVVAAPGFEEEEARRLVLAAIHEKVAKHKWPDDVKMTDALPRTASGKVRKRLDAKPEARP